MHPSQAKLFSDENGFYVYGLVDPTTNHIFYIGKGKGKRVYSHKTEKLKVGSNYEKIEYIEKIQNKGFTLQHILIGEDLNEESALLLEKLLIYRIGRKIFGEGNLLNVVPGGKWNKGDSLIVRKDEIPSLEEIERKYSELIPLLKQYPHCAITFDGLAGVRNEILFVFDVEKNEYSQCTVDSFINTSNVMGVEIINHLKNTSEPIYCHRRLYSKTEILDIEDFSLIPYQYLDIIDFEFVRRVNNYIMNEQDIQLFGFYPNGNIRTEINIASKENKVTLTYFYSDNFKKHITTLSEGRLHGKHYSWYPNGVLKDEIDYENGNIKERCSYFNSSNIQRKEYLQNNIKLYQNWFENGQLESETKEDGTSYRFDEDGIMIYKAIRNIGDLFGDKSWQYNHSGILIKERVISCPDGTYPEGYEKTFYSNGALKEEIIFSPGVNKKIIKRYNLNGGLVETKIIK